MLAAPFSIVSLGWVGVAVAGWKGDDKTGCHDGGCDECHGGGHEGGPVVTTPAAQATWPSLMCLASPIIPESVFQSHSVLVDSGEHSGLNSGMALFPRNM